jgi:hypothetical protein
VRSGLGAALAALSTVGTNEERGMNMTTKNGLLKAKRCCRWAGRCATYGWDEAVVLWLGMALEAMAR